jgi:hypothetical protein
MQQTINLALNPKDASSEKQCVLAIANQIGINPERIKNIRILKKSIDARHKDILINLNFQVFINEEPELAQKPKFDYPFVGNKEPVIIVGAGPAGIFAALRLIELGFKPVILERGKDVAERKKDVAMISRENIVNPESNYCFGEGGAGTFSDGKLYTRSNKKGNLQKIYEIFNFHGAPDEILYEAHPHLGTDKLPEIIKNIRLTILNCGGEVHFNCRADGLKIESNYIKGVFAQNGTLYKSNAVILATGHSARDIYKMLFENKVELEAKSFAMGVRVEHPQELINNIQYHGNRYNEFLPAASYSLAEQIAGRGVFSFCMCPGGFVIPSATAQNQVVTNGMSASKRNSPYANSGIVVEIKAEDLNSFGNFGVLAGIAFQENLENMAWQNGGRSQVSPAQRVTDFINNRKSSTIPKVSYFPGVISSPLHLWLPDFISQGLKEGFKKFNNKMRGFDTNEAVIMGVESRTSSPVRIPRNKDTYCHISVNGLYPCGEGAGYSGGIASSAMDGENCADKVAMAMKNNL